MKRIALVTGASKGIGLAITEKLKENQIEVLAPLHRELDLASNNSVDAYLAKLNRPIDILVNNAGINPLGETVRLKDENIEETIRVNLISPLRLIRGIVPSMIKNKYGRILNISSLWSVVSKPGRGVYSATKSGLNAITRSAAVELAGYNILVNAIAPGFVNTELTRENIPEPELRIIREKIPLGRLAETAEIAELAYFLCSDKNTYLTGQTILIDGGYTCL